MIWSFACSDTEALFHSRPVSRFRNIERVARRKLLQIHAATELGSLRVPPGNQLEALKADRKGGRLRVQAAHAEPAAGPQTPEALARNLSRMAGWLGLEAVEVESRGDLAGRLAGEVARLG